MKLNSSLKEMVEEFYSLNEACIEFDKAREKFFLQVKDIFFEYTLLLGQEIRNEIPELKAIDLTKGICVFWPDCITFKIKSRTGKVTSKPIDCIYDWRYIDAKKHETSYEVQLSDKCISSLKKLRTLAKCMNDPYFNLPSLWVNLSIDIPT